MNTNNWLGRVRDILIVLAALILALIIWLLISPPIKYEYQKPNKDNFILEEFTPTPTPDSRREKIKGFLEKSQSQLADYTDEIVFAGDLNNIDPLLLVSIAGQESSLGKYCIGNNCWGICSGCVRYSSLSEGIQRVSAILARPPYTSYAGTPANVEAIGKYWAQDPTWAQKVKWFYKEIDSFSPCLGMKNENCFSN